MASMKRVATCACAALGSLTLLAGASAEVSPEEQARRLLEDGRAARSQGKVKQALDSFGIIVTGFANTSSIDDALLEIGRTHLELTGDVDKARQAFEQVATLHPQGDAAPGAYYYLGVITLDRAQDPAELEDALAQFMRLQNVYADSRWLPRALYGTGLVQRRLRHYREAIAAERQAYLEFPEHEIAPAALFECAHALVLAGRPREAMEEYQRLRNRYPASELAGQALDRITALYRVYGAERPAFTEDPGFALPVSQVFKDVSALRVGTDNVLWVASASAGGVFAFADGKVATSVLAPDPVSFIAGSDPTPTVALRLGLKKGSEPPRVFKLPGDKPGVEKTLERLAAALPMPDGGLLVSDLRLPGICRFDAQSKYLGRFPDETPCEVTRLLRDEEGELVMLDERAHAVRVVDARGRLLRTIGPQGTGFALRRPMDVAIDEALNLYIADAEEGLLVLSADGQLLARIGSTVLKRPSALSRAADGSLYVYDDKLKKVLRFR